MISNERIQVFHFNNFLITNKSLFTYDSFIVKSSGVVSQNKRVTLMLFSKEANTKDTQLKSQLLLSFKDDDQSKGSENIWVQSGFFGNQRADLTIQKANFPELSLIYVNQAHVSLVKGGEKAIYCNFIILAQIMLLANVDPAINLDTYVPKDNEVAIYTPMYNTITRLYHGLTKKLGFITLRGDAKERFFSYGYSKEKSTLLYCSMKSPLPNIFSSTAFRKHTQILLDQNELKVKQSELFFFLPATLDRKEDFLQWKDNVHLHPIDFSIDDLKAEMSITTLDPSMLENKFERDSLVPGFYKFMKKIADLSNQNLIRNSDAYISNGGKVDSEKEFVWTHDSFKKGASKFQLNY